ncbi:MULTISPECIES: DUF4250 domain-containing protein [unclassified Clostridium]|jgi:hypothetical protein|uniref:DUF4250 domain-containing protein n=1 Tax=unclassified Clostridium TaxID=2614128 RepID=UPI0025BB104A|nr:DUF4250 domain-containing protein [Clostridium sp.]MCI6692546.1 DUF4250 domain-containing protein [Clostridium sp.]MDY2630307.1 DUF4250 domain-containing protein [Clostridium sp.]MDY4252561.1 DUF4250 domain-containing protein [Clostridium sp.]MDY6226731.1 DUF4250 domain-containing protein [Clostridium sp.]
MDKPNYIAMDPNILLSIINMKLRDFYNNLDSLCEDMEVNEEELKEKFSKIGYNYDETINQFR